MVIRIFMPLTAIARREERGAIIFHLMSRMKTRLLLSLKIYTDESVDVAIAEGFVKAEKRVKSTFDSCLYLIKIKRRHDPQVT